MVCRPEVSTLELHPDEGSVRRITTNFFYGILLNDKGQFEDELQFRKCVFLVDWKKVYEKRFGPSY